MAWGVASRAVLLLLAWCGAVSAELAALPSDVAEQASTAAFNFAWMATNARMGPQGDVAGNQIAAEEAMAQMRQLGAGMLTTDIVDHFQWLAFNSGWYAANTRNAAGMPDCPARTALEEQAAQNMNNILEHRQALMDESMLNADLVWNLNWMCWRASWYAANTRAGLSDDAKTDEAYFKYFAKLISGEVTLVSIDFDDDAAKVLSARPLVVGRQVLDNSASDHDESMTFAYSYTEGSTTSWSTTIGFKISIADEVKANFFFAEDDLTFSFSASFSHSWSGSSSTGITKSYTFPLVVPPHRIYEAKATVHQANMNVPYTMSLMIGDYRWTTSGTWSGVAVSVSTYIVSDITPGDPTSVMGNNVSNLTGNVVVQDIIGMSSILV